MDRRSFFKYGAGLTSLTVLGAGLSGCVFDEIDDLDYTGDNPFAHGVASGDPLHDRVIMWTRISQLDTPEYGGDAEVRDTIPVGYMVATDQNFNNVVLEGQTVAIKENDWTVKVDAVLPEPAKTYYYRFVALGYASMLGRTKTAPRPNANNNHARFCVMSCSNFGFGYFNAYHSVARRADIDAVIHLGDYIYEYAQGGYDDPFLQKERRLEPQHEIVTLDDYRTRYALYRSDPDLQECHRQHPFITVWDDHEIANDSYKDGAGNHTEGKEGVYVERKAAAARAYREWLPIRSPDLSDDLRIFRDFQYGKLLSLIMMDTRIFGRDKQDLENASEAQRQLLGEEQEAWLFEKLDESQARGAKWHILGQQVIMAPFKGFVPTFNGDVWNGYAAARDRVFDYIEESNLDNTVVLTGDYHVSFGFDLPRDPDVEFGYNPDTGEGSLAVEFVTTSVTSPGFIDFPVLQNPHLKFENMSQHGYVLLDVTKEAVTGEWHLLNTVKTRRYAIGFGGGCRTLSGENHLVATYAETRPKGSKPLAGHEEAVKLPT